MKKDSVHHGWDAVVQTRCNSTTLATIAQYMHSKGVVLTGPAALMREALELLEEIILQDNLSLKVFDVVSSRAILEDLGIFKLNPSGKALFTLQKREALAKQLAARTSIDFGVKKDIKDASESDALYAGLVAYRQGRKNGTMPFIAETEALARKILDGIDDENNSKTD